MTSENMNNPDGFPVGREVVIKARVSGYVDFGNEVQFQLPSGLFLYLPADEAMKVINDAG